MWVLTWIQQRILLFQDWFSNSYNYWSSYIRGIPNIVQVLVNAIFAYANNAYEKAKDFTQDFYFRYIKPYIDYVAGLINDVRLFGYMIYGSLLALRDIVPKLIQDAYYMTLGAIHAIYDYVIQVIRDNISYVINQLLPSIVSRLNTLLPFQAWLSEAARLLNISAIQQLFIDYSNTKNTLIALVSNPFGFIAGVLWEKLISFLCYLIAYSFGTSKYNLPTIPDWRNK